jgi:hypothetical protein
MVEERSLAFYFPEDNSKNPLKGFKERNEKSGG